MCYVIAPGNLEYPYSQTVWSALLATLNLDYISCASPVELLNSVLMRVDQHHQGLQTVAKLIFGAYVWHIWAERNRRIFKDQLCRASFVVHSIMQTLQSRLLYLGTSLLESVSCHWSLPSASYTHTRFPLLIYNGWRLSIYSTLQTSIGILWKDGDQPLEGVLLSAMDYYQGILRLVALIPAHLSSIFIETASSLSQILRSPHKFPWPLCFQVRSIAPMLQKFNVNFVDIQTTTVRFSKKLSTNKLVPSHISNMEIGLLWGN
eukprot:TRINITY_DN12021_c0_g3_i3.p1 TRINITY_DN12021_c0_g3~~TRINITY_DN12021_c0_g3_i3.p1  ORF type:complete len:262 (+),score=23.24 TRINITY_DN12021_c0_g3_i3:897-1682(+)